MQSIFSIIIPTYNSEATLALALDSIIHQTFTNFEILILDGLSKDNTVALASSYKDARIKIFCEADKGVYDAMNKGMKLAQGEWIYFIGSDDFLYDYEVLNCIAKELESIKEDVLYGNVLIKGDSGWAKDGQIFKGKFTFQKLLRGNICHQSMFYRRSFIDKNKLEYNLRYPVSADWDFNISAHLLTKFHFMDRIIAVFNAGGISTGDAIKDPFHTEINEKYGHLYRTSNYPNFLKPFKKIYKWLQNIKK